MINHVYCLVEVLSRTKYYIGFTSRDPSERLKEHKNAAKNYKEGDELKYQYSHALDALGIEWTLEVLHTVDITDTYTQQDTEDYYCNLYRDCPLTNMRAGNSSAWWGSDYTGIDQFLAAKKRYLDRLKFKQPKVKRESDVDKMLYSFEKPSKFVAPAFERLANRIRK